VTEAVNDDDWRYDQHRRQLNSLHPWQEEMLVRRRTYRNKHRRGSRKQRGGGKRYSNKTVRNFVRRCEKAGTEDDICYNAVDDPTYNIVKRRVDRKHALLR